MFEDHGHFENSDPEANPNEPVVIRVDNARASTFYVRGQDDGGAAVTFHPLLRKHLHESGWTRIHTDDMALLRIAKALEAIAARPVQEAEKEVLPLAREVLDIEERRQRRADT